jgi:hypothetical protein
MSVQLDPFKGSKVRCSCIKPQFTLLVLSVNLVQALSRVYNQVPAVYRLLLQTECNGSTHEQLAAC